MRITATMLGLACFFGAFVWGSTSWAGTGIRTMSKSGDVVVARTYDSYDQQPFAILAIPRGYDFQGTAPTGAEGLRWQSHYGYVGAGAEGGSMVTGGLNEEGLSAEQFDFDGVAGYQRVTSRDQHRSLAPGQLVSWVLANFSSVAQVRRALPTIKVALSKSDAASGKEAYHYFINDKQGNSLIIEYVGAHLYLNQDTLGVISNGPSYSKHLADYKHFTGLQPCLSQYKKLKNDEHAGALCREGLPDHALPGGLSSRGRFIRAALLNHWAVMSDSARDTVVQAFHILDGVKIVKGVIRKKAHDRFELPYTHWVSASDLRNGKYYFYTYESPRIRMVDLNELNLKSHKISQIKMAEPAIIRDISTELTMED